jgi:hypothetical protein
MINGFVYVIESPSAEDLLADRTEGRVLVGALDLAQIPRWYSLVVNRKILQHTLGARLSEAWRHLQKPPVVHLSMHGNQNGVGLTSGESLSWDDLRLLLAPLNNAMQGGLLICMSTCFGSSGCRMAMFDGTDMPFWALVGNAGSRSWSDAAVAYVAFYHQFFKGTQIPNCVDAMKMASGDANFGWYSGQQTKDQWGAFTQARSAQLMQYMLAGAPPAVGGP